MDPMTRLKTLVMLLNRIEGRDKTTKFFQYTIRLIAYALRHRLSVLSRHGEKRLAVLETVGVSLTKGRQVMRLGRFTYVWLPLIKHYMGVQMSPSSVLKLLLLSLKATSDMFENLVWGLEQGKASKGLLLACRNLNNTFYFLACVLDWFMTSEKITKRYFIMITDFAKKTAREIRHKLENSFADQSRTHHFGPSKQLFDISEGEEDEIREKDEKRNIALSEHLKAQVHRARVKFFKVTMDIVSAGSKLGLLEGIPKPMVLTASILSAVCVIHLEMTDISRILKKKSSRKRPSDHVRDRSVF
ncbi:hypothetical protein AAMO2058_000596000 [Amorphochlora amoebiformis]